MGTYAPNIYRKGLLPLIILLLLKDQDMDGYQMVRELDSRTDGAITTQEGALYPVLYVLCKAGYVTERKEMVKERRFRIVYHLEPAGEQYMREQIAEYEKVISAMQSLIKQAKDESDEDE